MPQVKVLLIEAGSNENLFMGIPVYASVVSVNQKINWNYRTKPSNKYCRGIKNNSCLIPRGKVIGGTSVLNYMIATRGSTEDYDRWAKMGNKGWAYKDVLKYFKKLETMDIPELSSDRAYHGTDGPVHITYPNFRTPVGEAFLKAGEELGYPTVNYNEKNIKGFSYVQCTIINGTRMSSNRAYLHPVRDRKNLRVTLDSTVTRVLIDSSTNRAVGVEFIKNGRNITVFASKEVILSAGAIGSPQLLMLSGVGPEKQLTELGINVIRNAPVGENLMDHIAFFGLTWITKAPLTFHLSEVLNLLHPYAGDFFIDRRGPYTLPSGCEALAFINTKQLRNCNNLPDMEILYISTSIQNFMVPRVFNFKDSILEKWEKYDTYGYTMVPILLKPKSRGRITLLANNINIKPEIVPNYFDDRNDIETMIAGIRATVKIGRTKAMQKLHSQLVNITYSECNYKYDSDAYWECLIRMLSTTLFHQSGTCKMGPIGDPTAVVDPKLKVIGIQGLRVADASVMPEIISGHPTIPIYMIAEKAVDMIKKEWGY
ncbi:hypothetical protein PUN28_005139 [Cardiocondyla obscurior]